MATIKRLLVANRGEIACRIFQTCQRLGVETVAVYSDADADARHVHDADHAVYIGASPAKESYLRGDIIVRAAEEADADAVHPGYGFLSEDPDFAEQVMASGRIWIGPTSNAMMAMSDKVRARKTVQKVGVPVVPGSEAALADPETAHEVAEVIGYPLMVKASAGGGGLGMTTVHSPDTLTTAVRGAAEKAERFFGSGSVYLEKFIKSARHIEVQVLGLPSGDVFVVGDRDCTVQRRHQKILEEAPAPGLRTEERSRLRAWAKAVAQSVDYRGAGTIEMIMDREERAFYFLEMNTRLQVEHPVTELVTGIDLVQAQLDIGSGVEPDLPPVIGSSHGHALEFRVYAEDPETFVPRPGTLAFWHEPKGTGIRVDSGYRQGDKVTPYYDPLLAKLCVHAADREKAIVNLIEAGKDFRVDGTKNNLPLLYRILATNSFAENTHDTSLLLNDRP